jgi:hypothetical protein
VARGLLLSGLLDVFHAHDGAAGPTGALPGLGKDHLEHGAVLRAADRFALLAGTSSTQLATTAFVAAAVAAGGGSTGSGSALFYTVKGDGTSDDTAAPQAMINASPARAWPLWTYTGEVVRSDLE